MRDIKTKIGWIQYDVHLSYLLGDELRKSIMPVTALSPGLALIYANKIVRKDHPESVVVRASVEDILMVKKIRPKLVE